MRLQTKLLCGMLTSTILGLVLYLYISLNDGHDTRRLEKAQMPLKFEEIHGLQKEPKSHYPRPADTGINMAMEENDVSALSSKLQELRRQRVAMSRDLNDAKRVQGQAVCNSIYLQKRQHPEEFLDAHNMPVSSTGGWCFEEGKSSNREHKMDAGVVPALSNFLAGKTVASFGDGPGDYRKAVLQLGQVKKYDAFDGAPFCEETSEGQVRFLDLTAPQYGMELYDWVVSLEVAEHIPAKYENVYVDNMVRHAREGVILSWALPAQDGIHHVNGQTLLHVKAVMSGRGFQLDEAAGAPLRGAASFYWLKNNMQVYRRMDSSTADPDEA